MKSHFKSWQNHTNQMLPNFHDFLKPSSYIKAKLKQTSGKYFFLFFQIQVKICIVSFDMFLIIRYCTKLNNSSELTSTEDSNKGNFYLCLFCCSLCPNLNIGLPLKSCQRRHRNVESFGHVDFGSNQMSHHRLCKK